MTDSKVPLRQPIPVGLSARGQRFWSLTVDQFELTKAELEVLTEVCRTLDGLDVLATAIDSAGAMVPGSQGQQVINPALTEARGQRQILHRLLAALALPDEDGDAVPSVQKLRAQRAAASRWSGHRKDVARRIAGGTE